jgi:hypothetical protein
MQNARRQPNSILTAESTWRRLRKAHAFFQVPHITPISIPVKTPLGARSLLSKFPEDQRSDSTKIRFPTSITTNSIDQMSVKFLVFPNFASAASSIPSLYPYFG